MRPNFRSAKQASLILGYRSGLEVKISDQLKSLNVSFTYESEKLKYTQPAKNRTYKPDFVLIKQNGNKMYIETKGRLTASDRAKYILVRDQNPTLDIRFVFQNSNTKIAKGSSTTYGDWASKNNFIFANKEIPKDWLAE